MIKTKKISPYTPEGKTNFKLKKCGVYLIYKDEVLRYVGFSKTNLYKTLYRHFQSWNDKTQSRVTYNNLKGIKVRVIYTNTPKQAYDLEKACIIKLKPKDNIQQYWLNYDTSKAEEKIYDLATGIEVQPIFINTTDLLDAF